MTQWHDENGVHEGLSDAELTERLKALRAAHKANDQSLEDEYRRSCDHVQPHGDTWSEMVKAENQIVPGLGDRDECHHADQAKRQRKPRERR